MIDREPHSSAVRCILPVSRTRATATATMDLQPKRHNDGQCHQKKIKIKVEAIHAGFEFWFEMLISERKDAPSERKEWADP